MGRQLLLPRCYQNTPYQEHLGAPSVSPNCRILVGEESDYQLAGQRFESSWAHHKISYSPHLQPYRSFLEAIGARRQQINRLRPR